MQSLLTLLLSIFVWNGRAVVSYRIGNFSQPNDNRSGGFPKFPQSFLAHNNLENKFFQPSYSSQQHNNMQTDANTCGTRSIPFNPKRSAKIIGGNLFLISNLISFITYFPIGTARFYSFLTIESNLYQLCFTEF